MVGTELGEGDGGRDLEMKGRCLWGRSRWLFNVFRDKQEERPMIEGQVERISVYISLQVDNML